MILLLLVTSCSNSEDVNDFNKVREKLKYAQKQFEKEPGVLITGSASDPKVENGILKLSFEIDHNQISKEQLKTIIESYFIHAAEGFEDKEWRSLYYRYKFQFEELGTDGQNKLVAEKPSNTEKIEWK